MKQNESVPVQVFVMILIVGAFVYFVYNQNIGMPYQTQMAIRKVANAPATEKITKSLKSRLLAQKMLNESPDDELADFIQLALVKICDVFPVKSKDVNPDFVLRLEKEKTIIIDFKGELFVFHYKKDKDRTKQIAEMLVALNDFLRSRTQKS